MNFFKAIAGTIIPVILVVAGLMMLIPATCLAARKNVLILNSYHQTNDWTDSVMQGMLGVFDDSGMDVDIHVEYLDTQRKIAESTLDLLEDFYKKQYDSYRFDVILLSGNPALEFFLHRRERLFPGVPVVFCAVNDFQEVWLQGQTDITGINTDIDIRGTIELALQINPDTDEFLVINDRSATGLVNRAKYEHDIAGLQTGATRLELFDEYTLAQFKTRLSALSDNAAILAMRFPTAGDMQPVTHRDFLEIIANNCRVPVFNLWSSNIGKDVLGGVMVDGEPQGSMAARYALRILQGEPVSSLPVVMESPNTAMIDYRQLERLGISEKAIPEDVQILFKPENLYEKYRNHILVALSIIATLVVIIAVLFINIVIRKRAEKALLESEKKLSTALKMAHLGHWEYDTTTNRFTFNDQFYAIFHATSEEVGGYTLPPEEYARWFVHPDDMPIIEKEIRKALETTDPYYSTRIEHRMRYADGTTGHLAVRIYIKKNDQGRTVRLYGVAQDITELRKAEESIIRSEERWRLILQTAMDGFSLADCEGRFIEVNDAFCRILGYTREELLGMRMHELSGTGQSKEQFQARIGEIIALGKDRIEGPSRRKDGKIIDTETSIHYHLAEGGLISAFLRDITENKQIEARLQQSQKMEAIGTLAGGIAHDFNNILQPMIGFCELLRADLPPDTPEQGFVDGIFNAAVRAKELVNQILSFSRQGDKEARPIKLQPFIKEAMKLLRSSIPTTIDIEQTIDPDCGIVQADPTQIYQVVMNLCTNAYHAMENDGGRLHLALEQIRLEKQNPVFPEMVPGDYALLKVCDTGVGIQQAILNKIFDPYFTTKEKSKGTGLGLPIVQGIVKNYNGDIRIYSEPGKGTSIHVYLPIMEKGEGDGKAGGDDRIQGGNERILLVDDEKPVVEITHQILERLGYRVTTRLGSMEALETFQSSPDDFDLVITDLTMPHMTGIQLAGEMKQIREDIPIILCTGFSEQSNDVELQAAGIRAKLAKPVITRTLAETVRKVLRR